MFKGGQWLLEQPGSSLVPKCRRVQQLATEAPVAKPNCGWACGDVACGRVSLLHHHSSSLPGLEVWLIRFTQGAHGADTIKPTMVLSNRRNIEAGNIKVDEHELDRTLLGQERM